jgi:2-phospho-L-lactate/phosphoenolpyruvate guanylyltransferase
MSPRRRRWTVVVPLKGGPGAKSRLGGPPGLAAALALDTLEAVVGAPGVRSVVVVTSDDGTAAHARLLGARVVGESAPGSGLLAAVKDGLAAAPDEHVAVLLGDLPALRPADLAEALEACRRVLRDAACALVPDADGTGSVLLAGRRPGDLDPAFGPASADEHVRRGAVRLDLDLPRLRRDVDTTADLAAVLALGAGPRTRACTDDVPSHARP